MYSTWFGSTFFGQNRFTCFVNNLLFLINVLQDMTTVCRDELRKLKKEDPRYSGELNSHAFFIANIHVHVPQ